MIRVTEVHVPQEAEDLVLGVLRSGNFAQGKLVARFEAGFGELAGSRHAIAVSNGTVALVAALKGIGIGPGDEVVTSPFTFAATVNAVLECGATVCFADIRADDFTLDVDAVADAIGPSTAAILPVHLYGQPADAPALAALARDHGLALVEDAAQAHGATVDDRPVGSFGTGCFSLYATKNMTTGEGGVVTTDDDLLADRIRLLRNQGMRRRYEYEVAGHNWRMTELQAAIGVAELGALPARTAARRSNAMRLADGLAGVPGLVCPSTAPGRTHVYHQFTVRVSEDAAVGRDELAAALLERGVETGVYYPRAAYDYECYRADPRVVATPAAEAERAARQVLSLPVHPWLEPGDIDRIIDAVRVTVEA